MFEALSTCLTLTGRPVGLVFRLTLTIARCKHGIPNLLVPLIEIVLLPSKLVSCNFTDYVSKCRIDKKGRKKRCFTNGQCCHLLELNST